MLLHWVAPLSALFLFVGWNRMMEDWQVALTLLFTVFGGWILNSFSKKDPENLVVPEGKVVSMAEYRKQRGRQETESNRSLLQNVYESQYLHEAELIASLLESEGIPTHVFNRHNASILIHPMGEMRVKVLVPTVDNEVAQVLIEQYQDSISPEDTSIA
jgi:hypothetical protein